MTATLVLPGTAPEADWVEARRHGVTASRIAAIMGLSTWNSPYKLYHQMRGDLPEDPDRDRLELGRVLEPYVCDRFAREHPEFALTGRANDLYAHPDRPWQMATPDRIVNDIRFDMLEHEPYAVLEAKTSATWDGYGDDGSDEIPVYYRAQALWQADVIGVSAVFVPVLFLPGAQLRVYELAIDDDARADLALMRGEAEDFLARVRLGDVPPVDWRPATADALKQLHPSLDEDREVLISGQLASRYRAAVRGLAAAKQKKALYDNKVREQLGTAHLAVDAATRQNVARRDVYDLAEKTILRKASTVDSLMPVKPKDTP